MIVQDIDVVAFWKGGGGILMISLNQDSERKGSKAS